MGDKIPVGQSLSDNLERKAIFHLQKVKKCVCITKINADRRNSFVVFGHWSDSPQSRFSGCRDDNVSPLVWGSTYFLNMFFYILNWSSGNFIKFMKKNWVVSSLRMEVDLLCTSNRQKKMIYILFAEIFVEGL